jgi:MerR family transcriptional regulator/heat shock protein HspR
MAIRRASKGGRDLEPTRGVYMISVAAELASMHPQTLRIYESRGLITPQRSPKGTRLYSQDDVDRLRRIQELTSELGMNLAGVERVFELEQELDRMQRRMERLEREAEATRRKLEQEVEKVRKSFKAELVPYTGARRRDLVPARAQAATARRIRVPIERPGA